MRTCCVVLPLERLELATSWCAPRGRRTSRSSAMRCWRTARRTPQLAMHEGYALPARQEQDVALLRRRAERRPAR